jgi:hypothetical protein
MDARGVEGWSVELVRSRQGGMGTRVVRPWSELYPELGLDGGGRLLDVGGGEGGEDATEDFHREQPSALRNGVGILGQRPGRDAPMPAMRAGLGSAAGRC